jgi:arsenate reductase
MGIVTGSANELRLLADPTRARIMALIRDSPQGRQLVGALATALELRQPTVSHHLKALFDEGLLEREPQGRRVWYSIALDHADRVDEVLQGTQETSMSEGLLDRISADLAMRFAGTFAPETVDRYVRESYALLAEQGRIPRHLPSLTSRFAADRLSALASRESPTRHHVPEVLFVCVQNAGRSQLAAGILRHLAGNRVSVRTAGSAPASAVRSVIVTALDEIGVAIGGEFPKPLTDEVVRAADVVVTMGCGDACPIYPGRRYLDWDLEDPVGLPLSRVRDIRDDIDARVRQLLTTLAIAQS